MFSFILLFCYETCYIFPIKHLNIFRNLNTKRCSFQGDYYSLKDATTIKTPFLLIFLKCELIAKIRSSTYTTVFWYVSLIQTDHCAYFSTILNVIIPISCNCWRQTGQTHHCSAKNKIKCRNTQRDKKITHPCFLKKHELLTDCMLYKISWFIKTEFELGTIMNTYIQCKLSLYFHWKFCHITHGKPDHGLQWNVITHNQFDKCLIVKSYLSYLKRSFSG